MFLAWGSLYGGNGEIVLSVSSLRIQRAKIQQTYFVFEKSWLDFVEEKKIQRLHKKAIRKPVTTYELKRGMRFEKHLKHPDIPADVEEAPMGPMSDAEHNERVGELTSADLRKHLVDKEVQVYFYAKSGAEATGWYNGIVTKIEGTMIKVFYEEVGTFSEQKSSRFFNNATGESTAKSLSWTQRRVKGLIK